MQFKPLSNREGVVLVVVYEYVCFATYFSIYPGIETVV